LNKVFKKIYEIQDYYVFDAVSVNVSLSEFMDYNLHDELIEIIKSNGVPCEKIRLEMTETMTSDEFDAIAHNMEEFNNAGVHFYLDDFGTGYSNLERIVSLPFKTIKFDKTLLYKSEDDPILMQLIQNMVDMFKNHGLVVLVEGVESEKQEMLSIKLGFEYIQGYRFAKPVPVETVQEFFEKKPKRLA
ncbi:MAG: EAL domain-containing protein, partial [Pseudobutyrivibrio sp.]|nr:EAL domain-containing protein [Pseudobutyrivibrio sp.]